MTMGAQEFPPKGYPDPRSRVVTMSRPGPGGTMRPLTVGDLVSLLTDGPRTLESLGRPVWLARDEEGNGFARLYMCEYGPGRAGLVLWPAGTEHETPGGDPL